MIRRPPISTRTDTLFPYTPLFRSKGARFPYLCLTHHVVCAAGHQAEQPGALDTRRRDYGRKRPSCDFLHSPDVLSGTLEMECAARRQGIGGPGPALHSRSEEHTSELQSLMRISYAVFCLQKKQHH